MYVQVEAGNLELKILLFEVDLEVLEENVVKRKKEKLMVVNQLQIVLIKFLTNEFFFVLFTILVGHDYARQYFD